MCQSKLVECYNTIA